MKFYEVVKKLQKENDGYLVLVKCGIFFTAVGKDAVILHDKLNMNVSCFKEEICKTRFSGYKSREVYNSITNERYFVCDV